MYTLDLIQAAADILGKSDPPSVLYHYTTQAGLLGILESATLWASKIRYTNDSSEFVQTLKWVTESLAAKKATVPKKLQETIENLIQAINHSEGKNICICSFTKNGNLLSQWRAYGGNAVGYSIGFETASLKSVADAHGFVFAKCIYEKIEQEKILTKFIDDSLARIRINSGEMDGVIERLTFIASVMKNSHFVEEEEWRLLSAAKSSMGPRFEFRSGKATIIPYYSIPLKENGVNVIIKEVTCGPSDCPELVKDAVIQVLFKYGFHQLTTSQVTTINSQIPYRRWS